MSFFLLRPWTEAGDAVVERMSVPEYFENYALGLPLPKRQRPAWFDVGRGKHRLPDILQGAYSYLLVSNRLKAVLAEQQPTHLDFQKVEVRVGRSHIADYWFVQPVDTIDAIDWSKSDITASEDDRYYFLSVRNVALDPARVGARRVFQVRGLEVEQVVDGATEARIKALDPVGIRLEPLNEYRLG